MTVIANKVSKKQFELPPEGPVMATLVEVRDLGMVSSSYGKKPKLLFVWDTGLTDDSGAPIKVFERFTNTLHSMGKLAPRVKSITGEFPDEDEDYDLTALEGTRAQLIIQHNVTEDGTYANIAAVIREKTKAEEAEESRVRKVEAAVRQRGPVVAAAAAAAGKARISDADIPF